MIRKMGRKICSSLLIFSLVCSSAVLGNSPDAQAAKKATLKTKSIKVVVGKKKTIKIKNKVKKCRYTFKSKNKKIASVTKKGVVKGKKAGKTTITVTETNKKGKKIRKIGKVKITVTAKKTTVNKDGGSKDTQTSAVPPVNTSTNPVGTPGPVQTQTNEPAPTENPNGKTTSVKVYMDSISDENLVGEVKGPGSVPTPTPGASGDDSAEATPVPTPQTIYNVDFEDGSTEPFAGRGSAAVESFEEGADGSEKSIKISGRASAWNGTQVDITKVVENGNKYDVSFWVKQTSGSSMKINTTFQYTDTEGTEKYDTQNSVEVKSDEWKKIEFTTQEVPEHTGDILLYWETPYDSGNLEDFYLDNFTMKGVVKTVSSDTPDLSTGLVKTKVGNPIVTSRLTADPYVMEYDGRIYVYGTNDSQQYELTPDANNNYAKINTLNCYSSDDMVNWTDHGIISVAGSTGAAKWAGNSWAPAVAHKTINGKEKFFLYFANSANSIGVLTADSPTGPWTDPIGKALIDRETPGCSTSEVPWLFDPAVLVDDDGTGYLYFGGIGDTADKDNSFIANPKCSRVIKLGEDMVSTDGEAQMIDAPFMFEDSGINKIGDKYYYSYCTNWTNFAGREVDTANIAVMVSDNPMTGFEYVGTVLKNPGTYFGSYGNNHHCFIEFKGKHYAFYHNKKDTTALGTKADYRTTYVDELNLGDNGDFTNSDGSIADTKMTVEGVSAVTALNPYAAVEAETYALSDGVATLANALPSTNHLWDGANQSLFNGEIGSYVGVCNVDFGSDGANYVTIKMSDAGNADYQDYAAALKQTVTGVHTVYFVFEKNNVLIDSWKFSK